MKTAASIAALTSPAPTNPKARPTVCAAQERTNAGVAHAAGGQQQTRSIGSVAGAAATGNFGGLGPPRTAVGRGASVVTGKGKVAAPAV